MKSFSRLLSLLSIAFIAIVLASCSQNAENEHLPEYCQTYSGFMETASPDMYELLEGINSRNYLTKISAIDLEFEVDDPYREIDLDGIQCFQNLTSLSLSGQSFKDISPISALKNIQQIELVDTSVVDISSFSNLSKVNSLVINGTKTLQSVDGVEEMTKLESLELNNNGIVNIDGLNQLVNLVNLDISHNEIRFFPSISNLENLNTLNISYNNIEYLDDDLSGLRNLKTLVASHNSISDISSLDDLENLEILDLSFNELGSLGGSPDFSGLENATKLEELYLNDNGLTSIADLAGKSLPLKILHLFNNELTDLAPIANYTTVIELKLTNNKIVDIADLGDMVNLTEIDISQNLIEDFSSLRSIPNLEIVTLSENNITFIPDISDSWDNLITLDLSKNLLQDTSGVEGHQNLSELILVDNNLEELSGISNLPSLLTLQIHLPIDEDTGLPYIDPETDLPYFEENPNQIRIITNSYNNVPNLNISDDGNLDLGYELADHAEIYGSFIDLNDITGVIWSNKGIDVIDEFSFTSTEIGGFVLDGNNLTDLAFLRGNPGLLFVNVSGNMVSDFSVLNGTTTTDFDLLEIFRASDLAAFVVLDNAFVDLPNLTELDLSNSAITSITNSINDIDQLVDLGIDGESLVSIDSSFNRIFMTYTSGNLINITDGNLESITDSFNTGEYEQIAILRHTPGISNTIISGSFNDLNVTNVDSIGITGSDFKTITNSFNDLTCDNLLLFNNQTEVITLSFENLDVVDELNLQNNRLETLDLSLVTNIVTLDLGNNILNTVSFVDGIPGLENIVINNQYDSGTTTLTLSSIDGINNLPDLAYVNMSENGFTSIDGFKNVGLTEFIFDIDDNEGVMITSISNDSFDGTVLTNLSIYGHVLTDIIFLNELTELTTLEISINIADLSAFSTMPFEANLEVLSLQNMQNIPDFAIFNEYDNVTSLSFESLPTTTLNNLTGLDSVTLLTLVNDDTITSINNSFNEFPSWSPSSTYLVNYSSLEDVSNSFNLYGVNPNTNTIELLADYDITASFINVSTVEYEAGIELTPRFDNLSFVNMQSFIIYSPNYDDYGFVNDYINLNLAAIDDPQQNINNFISDFASSISIQNIDPTISVISASLEDSARILIEGTNAANITISSNNTRFVFTTSNASVILNNTSLLPLNLEGSVSNLQLNNNNTETLTLNSFNASSNLVLNTSALTSTVRGIGALQADYIEINTDVLNLSTLIRGNDIVINDNLLESLTINAPSSSFTINSQVSELSVNGDFDTIDMINNNLATLNVNSVGTSINVESLVLDTLDLTATIDDVLIVNNSLNLDIIATNVDAFEINNNSITSISVDAGTSNVDLITTNNVLLDIDANVNDFTIDGIDIPSINFTGTSSIDVLDLGTLNTLNNIEFSTASINTVSFITFDSTLDLDGINVINYIISGTNIDDFTVNSPSGTVFLQTDQAIINMDVTVDILEINNSSLITTLNYIGTSSANELTLTAVPLINTINTNDATFGTVSLSTNATSFSYDGINTSTLNITGNSLVSSNLDVGTNAIAYNSTKTGISSASINATSANMLVGNSTLSINNDSVVTNLTINSTNQALNTLILGSADVENLDVPSAALSLTVSATQVQTVGISGNSNNIDVDIPLSTILNINLSVNSPITLATTTESISLTANDDLTVNSTSLTSADVELSSNDVTFNVTTPALDFTLEGDANEVVFNSNTLNTLSFGGTSNGFDILTLNNTNVTNLETSLSTISEVIVYSSIPSMTIGGLNLSNITLNTPNLTNLTSSVGGDATFAVIVDSVSLDLIGDLSDVTVIGDNLSSVDVSSALINDLSLETISLGIFDSADAVTQSLTIQSNQDDFDLTTTLDVNIFNGIVANNLNITSDIAYFYIQTNVNNIDFNSPTTSVDAWGDNLSNISGEVLSLLATNLYNGEVYLDLDVINIVDIIDNNITDIFLVGTRSIARLDIQSAALENVQTNNVVMNDLNVYNDNSNLLTVNSRAANIAANNSTAGTSVEFTVSVNDQIYATNIKNIVMNSTSNANTTFNYLGTSIPNLEMNNFNDVVMNSLSTQAVMDLDANNFEFNGTETSSLGISGTLSNVTIDAPNLNSFNVDALQILNTLNLDNTNLDDLRFLSLSLLASLTTLEIDPLVTSEIINIVTTLEGTGIILDAVNINQAAIESYYYELNYDELQAIEETTQSRYNSLLNDEMLRINAVFRTNEYFDYLDDIDLNTIILSQTYPSAQVFFDGYAADLGLTEQEMIDDTVNYGQTVVDNIKASIQSTLNDPAILIDYAQIELDVESGLSDDANTLKDIDYANKGFTITS